MISKGSFGAPPAWIGSTPQTPALNLFTSLFLSSFKLLLKASPLGSLPRSTKLLAATRDWPCLNLVLPWVFLTHLTHLPPPRALGLVLHSQRLGQASTSSPGFWARNSPVSAVCQSALIPVTSLTYIWFWFYCLLMYSPPAFIWSQACPPLTSSCLCCLSESHLTQGSHYQEERIACLCPLVDSIRTPSSLL